MSRPDGELVDIEGYLVHETADAFCMHVDEDEFGKEATRYWLPKSKTELHVERRPDLNKTTYIFTLPEWLATEKGLV